MKKTVMKISATLIAIVMIFATFVIIGAIGASAEEDNRIPIPYVHPVNGAYPDTTSFKLDLAALADTFPEQLEMISDGDILRVKDIGAGGAYYASDSFFEDMQLVDGYWTVEAPGREGFSYEIIQFEYLKPGEELDTNWLVSYVDGYMDPYIRLINNVTESEISVHPENNYIDVGYYDDRTNTAYDDDYQDGVLIKHSTYRFIGDTRVTVSYGADKKLLYASVVTGRTVYFLPEFGWSLESDEYVATAAPAGYENADADYFTNLLPPVFACIEHSWVDATCTSARHCTACNLTDGEPLYHNFGELGTPERDICSRCGKGLLPEFELPMGSFATVSETGVPVDEIRNSFPATLDVKYENGKYMIKDFGAHEAQAYNNVEYNFKPAILVDGYWVFEEKEEYVNSESASVVVVFYGANSEWMINYVDGECSQTISINATDEPERSASVYFYDNYLDLYYSVGDIDYVDYYTNGIFDEQIVELDYLNYFVMCYYNEHGSVKRVSIYDYSTSTYIYLYPEGWSSNSYEYNSEEVITPPADLAEKSINDFVAMMPTTVGCTHDTYTPETCTDAAYCLTCGRIIEGSEPLGHDIVVEAAVAPTCTTFGYTESSYCTRCEDATVLSEMIEPDGHRFVTLERVAPTCTEDGLSEGSACEVCGEVEIPQTKIEALGHTVVIDPAKAPTCTEEGLTAGEHCYVCELVLVPQGPVMATGHTWLDATKDAPMTCEICNETSGEPRPSISVFGTVAITVGSVALLGIGGFSLVWFVIKRKTLAELLAALKR